MRPKGFCGNDLLAFRKRAYLLRAAKVARKTLDSAPFGRTVQSGFLIEAKIDEKTGLALGNLAGQAGVISRGKQRIRFDKSPELL